MVVVVSYRIYVLPILNYMMVRSEMGIDYIANKVLDAFVDLGISEIKEALIETDRRKNPP